MNLKRFITRLRQRFCKHSCYYEGIEYNFGEPCFSYICEKCGKRIIVKHSAIWSKINDFKSKDCSQYASEKIALKGTCFPDTVYYHSGRNVGKAVCWYYEKYGILIRAYKDELDAKYKDAEKEDKTDPVIKSIKDGFGLKKIVDGD